MMKSKTMWTIPVIIAPVIAISVLAGVLLHAGLASTYSNRAAWEDGVFWGGQADPSTGNLLADAYRLHREAGEHVKKDKLLVKAARDGTK